MSMLLIRNLSKHFPDRVKHGESLRTDFAEKRGDVFKAGERLSLVRYQMFLNYECFRNRSSRRPLRNRYESKSKGTEG